MKYSPGGPGKPDAGQDLGAGLGRRPSDGEMGRELQQSWCGAAGSPRGPLDPTLLAGCKFTPSSGGGLIIQLPAQCQAVSPLGPGAAEGLSLIHI